MGAGELFGESFSCGMDRNATVSFWTTTDSKILFLSFRRIMCSCSMSCKFHHRLIENMVTLIAKKNVALMDKVDILSKKTLREKIATYLLQEAGKQNNSYFDIPLGRVQLAEYLCADRSALTRELNTMRDEGLIEYDRNTFHILKGLE
jgi:CRP-like cAMP-binding protein